MKPAQIKHDGDGKLYREEGEKVIWITEVEIREGDKIAKVVNDLVKEAYNEALEWCTKNAKLSLFYFEGTGFKEPKHSYGHFSINDGSYVEVAKESILKGKI